MNDDENDKGSFIERYGALMGGLVVAAIVAVFAIKMSSGEAGAPARKEPAFTMVTIAPPPPAPPPPPPPKQEPPKVQEQPKEEEMIEAPKEEPDEQPDPEPAKPSDEPPPLGTGIKGDGGPDGFGLKYGSGTGGGWGSGTGRRGGTGSTPLGQFGRKVSSTIQDALRGHPRTRSAAFRVQKVRLWCDDSGRVTRVKLGNSTGDPKLDAIIEQDLLPTLRFPAPPPEARMPIVVSFTAQRPN